MIKPEGLVRPGWKVLRVLANFLKLDGFDNYDSSEDIKKELEKELNKISSKSKNNNLKPLGVIKNTKQKGIKAIYQPGIYFQDQLSRRSDSLQKTNLAQYHDRVRVSRKQADKIGVSTGDLVNFKLDKFSLDLPVIVDSNLPDLNIVFPTGSDKTNIWADLNKAIVLKKVK